MRENPDDKPYPRQICFDCGKRYGRRLPELATWNNGECDVCGFKSPVTEPRDFGHLNKGWERHAKRPSPISDVTGLYKDDPIDVSEGWE